MCVVAAVGVCVWGGHKCLVQEQEEHVCFPLNATTYRNIRLDKLFTSWEVKREAVLCNLGSLHHEMWRYLTLVLKQFVLHTQAPAHYIISQTIKRSHQRATDCHAVPLSVHRWWILNRVPIRLIHFPCWGISLPVTAALKVSASHTYTHKHTHTTNVTSQCNRVLCSLLLIHWNYSFRCRKNRKLLPFPGCLLQPLTDCEHEI